MTLDRRTSVREQYRDASNLGARVDLHARYSTNPEPWPEWVFERLGLRPGAQVLEVGCGPGWLWQSKLDRLPSDSRIAATDLSFGMASEARGHLSGPCFAVLCADAQILPFREESFDLVVANHMLYHVPDLDCALAEFVRVLRPGGRFFSATNGRAHFKEVRDILDIHWRYVDYFGLDNGPDRISRYFVDISVERHPDSLEVPAVEPVIDYVRSMSTFWEPGDEKEADLRRHVAMAIERDGVFRISKDAGIITAIRR